MRAPGRTSRSTGGHRFARGCDSPAGSRRAAPVGDRERWVSIAGTVTVELGGAHDLASRYWDLDDPTRAADLTGILAEDQVRLVLHPETVHRYAY